MVVHTASSVFLCAYASFVGLFAEWTYAVICQFAKAWVVIYVKTGTDVQAIFIIIYQHPNGSLSKSGLKKESMMNTWDLNKKYNK